MEGRRAPQGLDVQDRIALGLTAPHLGYLVVAGLAAYALLNSSWPVLLTAPLAAVAAGAGAALAWGRVRGRPLDVWIWLALRFYSRPRRSAPAPPAPAANRVKKAPAPPAPGPAVRTPRSPARPPRPRSSVAPPRAVAEPEAPDEAGAKVLVLREPAATPPYAAEPGDGEATILTLPQLPEPEEDDGEDTAARAPSAPPTAPPVFLSTTQRIAFFSLKGGAGKTTLATEVATLLARRGYHRCGDGRAERLKVALLDLNLGSANVSMRLGLTHPTLWDLVMDPDPDEAAVEGALVEHRDSGLRAVLGPPRAVQGSEGRTMAMRRAASVLSHLDEAGYHFVFVDMGGEVNELTTYLLEACHHIYYVVTPTASGVQDTYRGVETLRRLGHRRKLRFVLNQDRGGFDATELLGDLGGSLAAAVPRDDAFVRAEDSHRPACLDDRGPAGRGIAALAAAIYPQVDRTAASRPRWRRFGGA